ncbi:GNAT family N-acetyltransferase [Nocardioides flavescens]|uniref:N-acetyltransferase domain-containing protein n=1 Tax=Nocardioides flavescens TaxID=2691959 RepID=A0A6L7ESM3_9ACTN|nr:GNAT family N-acetyltransferase [Nocardioides flavescens]MXG90437.1 hypothetical protein [Nocardioides flavescens]
MTPLDPELDPALVHREATQWIWVPEDARVLERPGFLLVAYPEHFATPTVATRWAPGFDDVDAVLAGARLLRRPHVDFSEISGGPLEEALVARGAELTETLTVLATPLDPLPALDPPIDVEVGPAVSLAERRAAEAISVAAFGGTARDDETLASDDWSGHVVARRDGAVVGVAGLTLTSVSARLWGAAVAPEARHTGVYRALLGHRLRTGAEAGRALALVKGRVETSAPVLARAGFASYGEVRAYRLASGG